LNGPASFSQNQLFMLWIVFTKNKSMQRLFIGTAVILIAIIGLNSFYMGRIEKPAYTVEKELLRVSKSGSMHPWWLPRQTFHEPRSMITVRKAFAT
jgi:hypothetical protein